MKFISASAILLVLFFSVFAQRTDETLATANGVTITTSDLSPQARNAWENRQKLTAENRRELLAQKVAEMLFELEAAERGVSVEKLLETEIDAKVKAPDEAQIQAVYEANRASIGDKTLAELRPQIVRFLRTEPERKATENFIAALKAKYKPVFPKDAGAPDIKPTDVLAQIGSRQIVYRDFREQHKTALGDLEAQIFDIAEHALHDVILSKLIEREAAAENLSPSDIIAREVTDKMRDFTGEERERLNEDFKQRLYAKYKVKILIEEPAPVVLDVSADDDPAQGAVSAPVTIVMFSDFQCSACAAVHPVLKNIIGEYKDKIRFVVRDFPLTGIHENAFQAAQAAQAANEQGKFFEYVELLYQNQKSLDTASLKEFASRIGLDRKRFDAALDGGKFAEEVRNDMADGRKYGVNSTPTIFVNGVKIRHLSAADFRKAIERALK